MNRLSREENDPGLQEEMRGHMLATEGARAAVVNRTHRVVREQAVDLRERKQRSRDLWVPLTICSVLLLAVFYAIWNMLDGYDLTPNGIPDASDQIMLLLLWLLPVTAFVLGLVWIKRGRRISGSNEAQQ